MADTRIKKGQRLSPATEFKKGITPHNKGKGRKATCLNCGIEFKPYCSKTIYCSRKCYCVAQIGNNRGFQKGSKVNVGRLRPDITGEKNCNWKGGVTTAERKERIRFRKILQGKILERDNYTCQICEQVGGYLQVDHIKSWRDYPELRFKENNCRTLCMACHYYITFKKTINPQTVWGHNLKKVESRLL